MIRKSPNTQFKILLADGDNSVVDLLSELLADSHTVITALNAADALTLASREHFQVIIADYNLPGLNGVILLKLLKIAQSDGMRVLLTDYRNMESMQEAVSHAVVFGFLNKPWNDQDLLKMLSEVLHFYYATDLKRSRTVQPMKGGFNFEKPVEFNTRLSKKSEKDGASSLIEDVILYNQANFKLH